MPTISGMFLFLAGLIILMGIVTAEIFYPLPYSISQNMISNLGATKPPHSVIEEPSAQIFDYSLILGGLLIITASMLYFRYKKNLLALYLLLMGIGTSGVGVFPAFHADIHPLVALVAFGFGSIAAIVSSHTTKQPFSFFSLILGSLALLLLIVGIISPSIIISVLGAGGTERWVFYPILVWLLGFGGYLMGQGK